MEKNGFYKETANGWYYAPNGVSSPSYDLTKELKDTYEYPVDGWIWSEEEPIGYVDIFASSNEDIALPNNENMVLPIL